MKLLAPLGLVLASVVFTSPSLAQRGASSDALEDLEAHLDALSVLAGQLRNHNMRRRMQSQIAAAERSLDRARRAHRKARRAAKRHPKLRKVIKPPAKPVAGAASFANLLGSMEAGAFPRDKMGALKMGLAHQRITTEQAARLVDTLAFGSDKIEALVLLHANLSDPQNFHTLVELLVHASDRRKLERRLGL